MRVSSDQLIRDARAGKIAPAYYFTGDDEYRIVEAVRFLVGLFLPEPLRASNKTRIDLNGSKFPELQDALSALTFFGERSVVIVIDPQKLSPKQLEIILKLLNPPVTERLVIFYTRAAQKPKKNAAIVKKLEAKLTYVDFPRLKQADAAKRVLRRLSDHGVKIESLALKELLEMSGDDLGRMMSEADKLALYSGAGSEVSLETVRHVCAESSRRTVYQLTEKLVAGDLSGALAILEPLLASGETPVGIVFWIGTHYLDLYMVKGGRNLPQYKNWLVPRLRTQARLVSEEEIEQSLSLIARCEALLKGGVGDSGADRRPALSGVEALTQLTLKLCNRTPVSARVM